MEYLQTRSSLEGKGASIELQIQMQQFYGDPSNERFSRVSRGHKIEILARNG